MNTRSLIVVLYAVMFSLSATAQVPFTFSAGQPAVADEVNANFTALVAQIQALQTQLDALQNYAGPPSTQTIPGTYAFIELAVDVDQISANNFSVAGESSTGTAVFNADGTGSVNSSDGYRQLSFLTQSLMVRSSDGNGTTPINSTSVQLTNSPSSDAGNFTWTYSGNVLTVNSDTVLQFYGAGSRIFVQGGSDAEGRNTLLVLVRR